MRDESHAPVDERNGPPSCRTGHAAAEGGFGRTIILATLALWTANYLLLTLRAYFEDAGPLWSMAAARLALMVIGCGFCWFMHLALRALGRRNFLWQAAATALMVPAIAYCFAWLNELGLRAIGLPPPAQLPAALIIMNVGFWLWFFLAWSTLYLAVNYQERHLSGQVQLAQNRELAHEAKLEALRYQVNPHFLFNTLNAVSGLIIEGRNRDADLAIGRLAKFFRASLASESLELISLREEIELQRNYLEIERICIPELELVEVLDPASLDTRVPALILQPLVENAVKFGLARTAGPAVIMIESSRCRGSVLIRVIDQGGGAPDRGGLGIGLANVRERLRIAFGGSAKLHIEARPEGGFVAELSIPERF